MNLSDTFSQYCAFKTVRGEFRAFLCPFDLTISTSSLDSLVGRFGVAVYRVRRGASKPSVSLRDNNDIERALYETLEDEGLDL